MLLQVPFYYELYIQSLSTLLGIYYTFFFFTSAAVACPLAGLTRCVFRDALLHTTVVMRGYLHCCHFPDGSDQSGPSPLQYSLQNLETVMFRVKIPRDLQFLRYSNQQLVWHQQLFHGSSPFWHLV